MDDIVRITLFAKIDQIMSSDGMINLLVTLDDGTKYNLKKEDGEIEGIFLGCIYEFEIAKYANSEKNSGYIVSYKHITETDDIEKLNSIYRRFMNSSKLDYKELKDKLESYINKIDNKILFDITKAVIDKYSKDFYLYPAATKFHHAYVGGLAYHTIGMLDLASGIMGTYPYINKDLLYAGCILHDIGKVIEFSGVEATEYGVEGQLLGHLLIGCLIIESVAKELGYAGKEEVLLLSHMIASHHGVTQFGAIKRPATAEAAMLWYVDSIDSKFRVLGEELEKTKVGSFTDPVGVMDKVKFYKHKYNA